MTDRLQVIWNKRLVGTLDRHKKGRVVFQYSQNWLGNESSPVSLSLPCRKEKFAPGISKSDFTCRNVSMFLLGSPHLSFLYCLYFSTIVVFFQQNLYAIQPYLIFK